MNNCETPAQNIIRTDSAIEEVFIKNVTKRIHSPIFM